MTEPGHASVGMAQRGNDQHPFSNQLQDQEYADNSGPLFSMYQKMTKEQDDTMVERWQKDADGIIIFTGLFSATVAALVSVTVVDLKQNPQDTSAFYLENMYKLQVLADPNISRPFIPSTPAQPPPFSPPKYVIWVNSLWFLSLVISLTCAMLAILLQQWARRYLRITQPPQYSPHRRARIRAFYADGVDKLRLTWVVEALPSMIHLSLLLFFTGLLIYLFNVSHPVFFAVIWWVVIFAVGYLGTTFMPNFWLESPYYTPLTSIVGLLRHKEKMAEEVVQDDPSKIDGRILEWTCDTLVEDDDLEKFFEMIPGFCNSDIVQDPLDLSLDGHYGMSATLFRLLVRTYLSNSLSESDKSRRFVIGVNAADAARLSFVLHLIIWYCSEGLWHINLYSAKVAEYLKSSDQHGHKGTNLCAQCLIALAIADVQGSDDRWVTLATDHLGGDLPLYLQHGKDSVLLANLIHIIRLIFCSVKDNREVALTATKILPLLYKFDIRNTLPELQHEFCALWNEIVSHLHNNPSVIGILPWIRHLHIDLHQGTDAAPTTALTVSTVYDDPSVFAPSSYPLCHGTTGGPAAHNLATPTISFPAPNPAHTGRHPPDVSSGAVPETSTRLIPVTTSSGSASRTTNIPSQTSQDIATDGPREGVTDTPSPADPIIQSTVSGGASLQLDEALATIVSPAVVAGSLSSPTLMPVPSSALVGGLHSPTESSVNESDRIPHGPISSSLSLRTASPPVAREVASSSDPGVTTAISSHNDTQDMNVSTQSELPRDPASHSSNCSAARES